MANSSLINARDAKNDEFYTLHADIEKEINAYLDFDENVFKNKTILLPCDDPEWSNFTKFFAQNFQRLGLKKLISTSYAVESKIYKYYQPTLFETESPIFDNNKTRINGKIFTLTKDENNDGKINIDDLKWNYLKGDGDFRSEEVKLLRDEADIIITNPPFSLFREFVSWIMEANKKFLIIGNENNVSYKEFFPLLKDNKVWLGTTAPKMFTIPEGAEGKNVKVINGIRYQQFGNTRWFTNLEHGRRHEKTDFMTMEQNLKHSKHRNSEKWYCVYEKYDNYNAIRVPYFDSIPSDYSDVMAVPISFIENYCPEQFEIVGITDRGNEWGLKTKTYTKEDAKNYSDLNRRSVVIIDGNYKMQFPELLVRFKRL